MARTELGGNGSSKNCDLTLSDGHGGIFDLTMILYHKRITRQGPYMLN